MALLNWKAFRCDFNARFTSKSRPLQLRKVSFFYWIQKLLASILGEWKGVPVPIQNLPSPWLTCFNSAAVSAQSKGLVPRPLVFGCFLVRSHQGGIDRTIDGKQCRLYTVKLHSSFLIFFGWSQIRQFLILQPMFPTQHFFQLTGLPGLVEIQYGEWIMWKMRTQIRWRPALSDHVGKNDLLPRYHNTIENQ